MIVSKAACGMGYALKRRNSRVAYCSISIKCGTRDEGRYPEGIAHFTEHTIFRGTARRGAKAINGCLDALGGDLNAFTTKEETVIHATVLKEDLDKALSLLLDLATSATFPSAGVETERGVILDEIISYKDSPAEDIFDRFEAAVFEGHPLGRLVLGTRKSVQAITPDILKAFFRERYSPASMALAVVADIDEKTLERKVRRKVDAFCGTVPAAPAERPPVPVAERQFNRTVNLRNHEVNAIIGGTAPSLYDGEERYAAALLCNIIAGPASNSILGSILREKKGWVYSVESSYTQYSDSGLFAISFGCEQPNLEPCMQVIAAELEKLTREPLPARRVEAAKKQLLGQLAISSEGGEADCLSMGKSLLSFGNVPSDSEIRKAIGDITPERLYEAALRLVSTDRLSSLVLL